MEAQSSWQCMRRVQGRPQSPWNKGFNLFVPYDKLIPLQKVLNRNQGGFAVAPLTPSQSPFLKGHCSETFKFQYKSTSSERICEGVQRAESSTRNRKALWNKERQSLQRRRQSAIAACAENASLFSAIDGASPHTLPGAPPLNPARVFDP